MNSKQKGKRGELEVAEILRNNGFPTARRGVQYKGGHESPDVIGMDGVHLEVKRMEHTDVYSWMAQAKAEADKDIPAVVFRKNGEEWNVIVPLYEFINIVKGWQSWQKYNGCTK